MGTMIAGGREDATCVATFTGATTVGRVGAKQAVSGGTPGQPFHAGGPFNLTVIGASFAGTWRLVRSFDGGTTWVGCTSQGIAVVFSGDASEAVPFTIEGSVLYDVEILTRTAGSISGRLSR